MLANEKRLHLVEFREENDNFPRLVASPESGPVRTKDEIGHDEILDFEIISFDGHMPNYKPEKKLFFERLPTYQVKPCSFINCKVFCFRHQNFKLNSNIGFLHFKTSFINETVVKFYLPPPIGTLFKYEDLLPSLTSWPLPP